MWEETLPDGKQKDKRLRQRQVEIIGRKYECAKMERYFYIVVYRMSRYRHVACL